jgi:hypothetical protein
VKEKGGEEVRDGIQSQ